MPTILDTLSIAQCVVSYGKEASFAGSLANVAITVTPKALGVNQLRLVWAATGDIFSSFTDSTVGGSGTPGIIVLPQTGQDGFRHGTTTFKDWYYEAAVTATTADGQQLSRTYRFQIPAGTTTLDLDMLDEDGVVTAMPAIAPIVTEPAGLSAETRASLAALYLAKPTAPPAPTLADVQAITGLRWCFTPDTGFYSDQAATVRQTTDGGPVKAWGDASPNADHAKTGTAGLTFKQAGAGALNVGGAAVDLITTGTFDSSFDAGYTYFVVAADPTLNTNRVAWSSGDNRVYHARNGTAGQNNQGPSLAGWSYNAPFIPVDVQTATNTTAFPPGIEIEAWRHNGPGNPIDTWYDGYSGAPVAPAPGSAPALTGALHIGGYSGDTGYQWGGLIHALVIFNRPLANAEIKTVYEYLADACHVNAQPLVECIGNSLTAGTNSSTGVVAIPGNPRLGYAQTGHKDWPSQLLDAMGPAVRIRMDAVPGRASTQILTDLPQYVEPFLTPGGGKRVALVWEVSNDLAQNILAQNAQIQAGTDPDAYTNIVTICSTLKAQGWTVGVFTCLPRGDLGGTQSGMFSAAYQVVNRLIRRNWASFADFVVDVAGDPRLGAPGAEQNATYFGADHVHLTDAGYTIVTGLVQRALGQVL